MRCRVGGRILGSAQGCGPKPFFRDKVWRWLRKNPGSTRRQVTDGTGLRHQSVGHCLSDMKRHGLVSMDGTYHDRRWYAVGTEAPFNGRGHAPGTVEALRTNGSWKKNLKLAFEARGLPHIDGLSRCAEGKLVFKSRRERAPAKSVQIPSLGDLASSLLGD